MRLLYFASTYICKWQVFENFEFLNFSPKEKDSWIKGYSANVSVKINGKSSRSRFILIYYWQGVSQKFPIWAVRSKFGISQLYSRGVWGPALKGPSGFWGKALENFGYLTLTRFFFHLVQWWEKYISKCSLIKHTCSWRNKLTVLWALNRQAKIFLRISIFRVNVRVA